MCKIIELLTSRERRGRNRERREEREGQRDRGLQPLKYVDMWRITPPSPCTFKGSVTWLLKFYVG
jgi:hypothetical protein